LAIGHHCVHQSVRFRRHPSDAAQIPEAYGK
jgi:hypothetical protein